MEEEYENQFYHNYNDSDKNNSELFSSSYDEEESIRSDDDLKKNWLVSKILNERKISIKKILNFMTHLIKLKIFKKIILSRILETRINSTIRIQRFFKYFTIRNLIDEIKKKEENNFTILSSIKYVKHIYLKVYLADDSIKIFHFDFCKLRNCFVLYIPREISKNCVFRVNFIADGKILIDSIYKADYDIKNSGMFYNIIEFNKIEKIEKNQKEDKKRILKYYHDKIRKRSEYVQNAKKNDVEESSSETDDRNSESKSNKNKLNKRNGDVFLAMSNTQNFFRNITAPSLPKLTKMNSCKNTFRSSFGLPSPLKSILRNPSSSRHNISSKRVSFCEDQK